MSESAQYKKAVCPVCKESFFGRHRALDEHLRDAHLLKRLDPNDKFELS